MLKTAQDDSELLSGVQFTGQGNSDNNLDWLIILRMYPEELSVARFYSKYS
jgi:hypothetical protein